MILPSFALHRLLRYLKQDGSSYESLLKEVADKAGFSASIVKDWSNAAFPGSLVEAYIAEWGFQRAAEITGDPCIALHCSATSHYAGIEPLMLALMSADNVKDAVIRVLPGFATALIPELWLKSALLKDGRVRLTFGPIGNTSPYRHLIDFCLSECIRIARRLPDHQKASPHYLAFTRTDLTQDAHRYESLFGCPVYFSQDENAIELGQEFLDLRSEIAGTHRSLGTEILLNKQSQNKVQIFSRKVREAIAKRLGSGAVSIELISSDLNTTVRTLQSKLAAEDELFRSLLEKERHQYSLYLLKMTSDPISKISDSLGYSSEGSFIRAFTRWEGESPTSFRKKMACHKNI